MVMITGVIIVIYLRDLWLSTLHTACHVMFTALVYR